MAGNKLSCVIMWRREENLVGFVCVHIYRELQNLVAVLQGVEGKNGF